MSFPPSPSTLVSGIPSEEANTDTSNDSRQKQKENDHYQLTSSGIEPPFISSFTSNNQQQLPVLHEVPIARPICDISHLQPALQNVVSTVNLGCELDLKRISLQVRNAEYNPKRFSAVIMRIRQPRTTALIFGSGKLVCTGARSEEDSLHAARRYARVMQKLAFPVKFCDFKIVNMVGSIDFKFPLRFEMMEKIALSHKQFCNYEPEVFPGLIYRLYPSKIVLLIFVSGKMVLTGAKTRREMNDAFEKIYPILKQCRK